MKPIISINNLTYKFNNFIALDKINLDIKQGEIVAIIGPNGSGKTTLIKNIIGVYQPFSGSVRILDTEPAKVVKKIGYVPQKFEFDHDVPLTIHEFISLEKCHDSHHGPANISQALKDVGLSGMGKHKLGELSGGQFQRVMIAKAILHEKSILILDEPSSGIDMVGERTIYDLIKKINQSRDVTCLLVSHELNIVSKYADTVVCLNKQMICAGRPEKVVTPENLQRLYGLDVGLYHSH